MVLVVSCAHMPIQSKLGTHLASTVGSADGFAPSVAAFAHCDCRVPVQQWHFLQLVGDAVSA
jgi:hypothetical protein